MADSIVVACDHAGLPLKDELVAALAEIPPKPDGMAGLLRANRGIHGG